MFRKKITGTLQLQADFFGKLHKELLDRFENYYKLDPDLLVDYQLYGYNDYNVEQPSIVKMIKEKCELQLNGKYLYNKWRELKKGAGIIKLSREYSFVFFHCLGYKDIYDYIERSSYLSEKEKRDQMHSLLGGKKEMQKEYYIGYYYGEEGQFIKSILTLNSSNLRASWTLFYNDLNKILSFEYKGRIIDLKNTITIFFPKDLAKTRRDAFMCIYYGNENVRFKSFLKGIYSGYNTNDSPSTGEIIFERINVQGYDDLEKLTLNKVDPIIKNYLYKKRISIKNETIANISNLSSTTKYLRILHGLANKYIGLIYTSKNKFIVLNFKLENDGKVKMHFNKGITFIGYLKPLNHKIDFSACLKNNELNLQIWIHLNFNSKSNYEPLGGYISGRLEGGEFQIGEFSAIKVKNDPFKLNLELKRFLEEDRSYQYSSDFRALLKKLDRIDSIF